MSEVDWEQKWKQLHLLESSIQEKLEINATDHQSLTLLNDLSDDYQHQRHMEYEQIIMALVFGSTISNGIIANQLALIDECQRRQELVDDDMERLNRERVKLQDDSDDLYYRRQRLALEEEEAHEKIEGCYGNKSRSWTL